MNSALVALLIALLSAGGSLFAVVQNRKTDDRKTDVSEFEAIVGVLRQDNNDLRIENRRLKVRLEKAEARIASLEGRSEG